MRIHPHLSSRDLFPGPISDNRKQMSYWVYMLASRKHGTLYIGMTNDIGRRVWEHREGCGSGFVAQYGVTRLVYMEPHDDVRLAIQREKTMKEWPPLGRSN